MNSHQDSQLNRGRCSYSPKQHTVYVVDEEEVNPYQADEETAPVAEQVKAKPETGVQSNTTFNLAH